MVIRNLKSGRRLTVLALFAILAMSAFGFAASNVVPASQVGDGEGAITGYTVSDISYNLSNSEIGVVASVSFTLSAAATEVQVAFDGSTTPISCAENGVDITCNLNGENVLAADIESLRVIAAQ